VHEGEQQDDRGIVVCVPVAVADQGRPGAFGLRSLEGCGIGDAGEVLAPRVRERQMCQRGRGIRGRGRHSAEEETGATGTGEGGQAAGSARGSMRWAGLGTIYRPEGRMLNGFPAGATRTKDTWALPP
jgi:hypothetical protein